MARRRLQKVTATILVYLFMLFLILSLLFAYSLLPLRNNFKIVTIASGSMGKGLSKGSLALIKPQKSYQLNDVITFQVAARGRVTHRLVQIEKIGNRQFFTTKGDANADDDIEKIADSQIIGRVLFSMPLLGYVIGSTRTIPGLIIFIIIPGTLIVFEELKKIIKELKRK